MILKPNECVTFRTSNVLHLSQSALDLHTIDDDEENVQVWIKTGTSKNLVATLNKNIPQVRLDLAFSKNELLQLMAKGTGTVHLTGYFIALEDQGGNQQNNSSVEDDLFAMEFNDGENMSNGSRNSSKSELNDSSSILQFENFVEKF